MELFDDDPSVYASACFPPPRPFQVDVHDALRSGVRAGHKNQLVMAPTGGGKTYIGLRVIHEALAKGRRAMFVCDRTTLIDQTSRAADRYGLNHHGVMQANHWRNNPRFAFQIASAQTLAKRGWPGDIDVTVIDEAHTQHSVWTEHIPTCKAAVIGLSATPFSPGLGKLFTNLINATTMKALTDSGVLVPLRVMSCTQIDMAGAKTIGGEWTDRAAEERGMEIIGDVVTEWLKHAENRKTIVFGSTIKHCEEMCQQFSAAGVPAAVFTSKTKDEERESLLNEYCKPDSFLRVLISVEALAKGFDVPDVGCVVDCRPLRKSLSTAIQMWGRGLRSSPETGKTNCILLDHSGNVVRFAEDFGRIFFEGLDALDDGEKLDKKVRLDEPEKKSAKCPRCGYQPFVKRCMSCGFEHVEIAMTETLPGEMREIVINGKKIADDQRHLWNQICTFVRSRPVQQDQRKQYGYAMNLFRDIAKREAPSSFRFSTMDVPVTAPVMGQIRHRNIARARARAVA